MKTHPPVDPQAQEEAAKYDNPIPSRELILKVLDEAQHPLDFESLVDVLGLTGDEDRSKALKFRMRAMERDAQVLFNRRRKYVPISHSDLIAGKIQGHPDGFGFLLPDEADQEDVYLSSREMRQAFHGDKALVSVTGTDRKGRQEGVIVEVTQRNSEEVVGRYYIDNGVAFLSPENSRIAQDFIVQQDDQSQQQSMAAEEGDIVVAVIVQYPSKRHQAVVRVTEVLGASHAPGMETQIAIRSFNLPYQWNGAIQAHTAKLGKEVEEADKAGREDLRHLPLVTIDGEDSRDFDDAVYCEKTADGWKLYVAIADVSHYVEPGSALDEEALTRGTSVYFPSEVVPMLPEAISNGLCSLMPQVDRLCMLCEMDINGQGEISAYRFSSALMHSAARLTYNQVAAMVIEQDSDLRDEYAELVPHLDELYSLFHAFHAARVARGTIDFDTTETKVIYADDKRIDKIVPYERNDAHKIIEECMIAANASAARYLKEHQMPAPHRVHPQPDYDDVAELRDYLASVGFKLEGGTEPHAREYAKVLKQAHGRADFHVIQMSILRSLAKASYQVANIDEPEKTLHFGLAQTDYAHFTSPIRRYPDLLVHRALKHITSGQNAAQYIYDADRVQAMCKQCSETEIRADDASREVMSWLKCEYMSDKVGETFMGVVTTVTSFGLFVELEDLYVEGLVHISQLPRDYYHFDGFKKVISGESSGKTFQSGDRFEVIVAKVNMDDRKIDFVPLETQQGRQERDKSKKGGSKKGEFKKDGLKKDKSKKSKSKKSKSRGAASKGGGSDKQPAGQPTASNSSASTPSKSAQSGAKPRTTRRER